MFTSDDSQRIIPGMERYFWPEREHRMRLELTALVQRSHAAQQAISENITEATRILRGEYRPFEQLELPFDDPRVESVLEIALAGVVALPSIAKDLERVFGNRPKGYRRDIN